MSDKKYEFAKPWLGAVLHRRNPDAKPVLVYWTPEPIVACSAQEAQRIVFAEAVRANPDLGAAGVEASVIPFSPYGD